jgi:ABC-2 type transport system permease protein
MTGTIRPAQSRMPSIARLLAAQIGYQARLLMSGRAITIGIGFPIILLIASHQSHTQTTDADVAQYAVFGLTLTAWNTYGVRLVAAREGGILKRWWATPLPRWCYFLGRILATVAVATVAGAATVAAGALLYNNDLTISGALGALVAFVLGSFAWAAAATALTAVVPTLEAAAPTFLVTYFPVIIISGVFGAISEPHWLSTIASYLPAQPLAHAVGIALGHTSGHTWLPSRDLAVLAVWAVAGMAIAVGPFRWEPHRPTQRRPARPSRQTSPNDPGTKSSSRDAGASTTTTSTPMSSETSTMNTTSTTRTTSTTSHARPPVLLTARAAYHCR